MLARPEDKCITIQRLIRIFISSFAGMIFLIVVADLSSPNPYSPGDATVEITSVGFTIVGDLDPY
jgi:hypothetical protein